VRLQVPDMTSWNSIVWVPSAMSGREAARSVRDDLNEDTVEQHIFGLRSRKVHDVCALKRTEWKVGRLLGLAVVLGKESTVVEQKSCGSGCQEMPPLDFAESLCKWNIWQPPGMPVTVPKKQCGGTERL
jgi:hypothetical protein